MRKTSKLARLFHSPSELSIADVGLAVERTFLAWQRTALAVVIGSAVGARYFLHVVPGVMPAVLAGAGCVLGVVTLVWVRRRYTRSVTQLVEQGTLPARSAVPLLMVAGAATACAVAAAVVVVV